MPSSILYLTYDGLTDPLGQSQILPYLNGLADKGHDITVVSFEKGNRLKAESMKLKVNPLKYHKSPPVISTLYDLYMLKKAVQKVLKSQQIDIIHCRSYITSLIGLWAKRKYGVKFVFDMRGFWADERVEGGIWNIKNPLFRKIYRYFKIKEKQFIQESDAVISLTSNAKNEILSWKGLGDHASKITVLPTCADFDHFSPLIIGQQHMEQLQLKYGIRQGDYVLLYLGSLGTWYMLKEMLDFYDQLRVERAKQKGAKDIKFFFVTKDQDLLHDAIQGRNYTENEIIVASASREEVPLYITLCAASIFFIIPTFSKKASAATKMAEIMAMGKPVITNSGWGDVEELVTPENGITISDFHEEAYKEGISALKGLEKSVPSEIRSAAEKVFSLSKGVAVYHDIYQDIGKH